MRLLASHDTNQLLEKALQGVDVFFFDKLLKKTGLPKSILLSLIGLNARQLGSLKSRHKSFKPLKSELLLKLDSLFSHGEETFEDMGEFTRWLQREVPRLNSRRPIDLLCSCTGTELVDDELHRIEHGYVV